MKTDRSVKPLPSSEVTFNMIPYEKFSFKNGLDVYFIKKDELPIVRINVIVNSGSKFDPANRKGTANLLAMCLDEGAGEFNSLELSEQFDLLGARFSLHCNSDTIQITVQTLKENFSKAMRLLSMVLKEPHLKQKDFERERRKIQTKLKQLRDDPDYIASTSFESLLFGSKNPYSYPTMGLDSDITRITNEEINLHYHNFILPNNTFVIVTGDISEDDMRKLLEQNLSDWQSSSFDSQFNLEKNVDSKKVYIINKKDSVQTEIRAGHHTSGRNSEDYFARHLLNTILGGQFTSRINLNLREKHGYTYGAGSDFNYYKNSAYFDVSTSVGIENTFNALREIFSELNNIRKGITEEELNFAKSAIIRKFPLNFETYGQVSSNIIGMVIHNLPFDYFNTYIENINSVTLDAVNIAAGENIFPELTTTVLVGDKDKLAEQVKDSEFGRIEIVD